VEVRLLTRCALYKESSALALPCGCFALFLSYRRLLAASVPHWLLSNAPGPRGCQAAAHLGMIDRRAFRTTLTAFRICRTATRQLKPAIIATSSPGGEQRRRSSLLLATPSWQLLAASCLPAPFSSLFCTRHDGPPP